MERGLTVAEPICNGVNKPLSMAGDVHRQL